MKYQEIYNMDNEELEELCNDYGLQNLFSDYEEEINEKKKYYSKRIEEEINKIEEEQFKTDVLANVVDYTRDELKEAKLNG